MLLRESGSAGLGFGGRSRKTPESGVSATVIRALTIGVGFWVPNCRMW